MQSIRKLFWISRPISWLNTAYPFAIGYVLTIIATGAVVDPLLLIIGTIYFLIPYNLLMYGINDVYDYESDIANPRKGGVEGMKESRAFHPTIIRAATYTNVPFLLCLFIVSSWEARAVLLLVVFSVIAYSMKGLRFKEIPILDSITSSFHFVGPLLFGVALAGFTPGAWLWIIAFFLWGIASHAFGAVQDILPDRKAHISSIATKLGARFTVIFSFTLYLAAAFIVLAQGIIYLPVALVGFMYCANIAPYLTITNEASASSNKAWRRFIWLNFLAGMVATITILLIHL